MKSLFIDIYHIVYFLWYFKDSRFSKTKENGKTAIIYSAIPFMYITPFEFLLYHLLRLKGYNIKYMIYPKKVYAAELITKNIKNKDAIWAKIYKKGKWLLNAANIAFDEINLDNIDHDIFKTIDETKDKNQLLGLKFESINFGDITWNALCRYYKSTETKNFEVDVVKRFLKTSILNYLEIKNRAEFNKPDLVFMSHGIYITWESVRLFCEQHNIKYACYDRGKTKDSININYNNESPKWDFNNYWELVEDKNLSIEKRNKALDYLNSRILQKNDVFSYNPNPKTNDIKKLKQSLGINDSKTVITLFTNLIWDAANTTRDLAFTSMKECIIQTIDRFSEDSNYQILVRPHPAEKVLGTNQNYEDVILEHYNFNLPSNVKILQSSNSINSFDVIDITDIAIVNTSTIGIELAIKGKNVILISETNFRNKGFTIDVTNKEEYFEKVFELSNQTSKETDIYIQEKALKYFYILMFEYQKIAPMKYRKQLFIKYSKPFRELHKDSTIKDLMNSIENSSAVDFMPNYNEF